jgi:hypothetical protein
MWMEITSRICEDSQIFNNEQPSFNHSKSAAESLPLNSRSSNHGTFNLVEKCHFILGIRCNVFKRSLEFVHSIVIVLLEWRSGRWHIAPPHPELQRRAAASNSCSRHLKTDSNSLELTEDQSSKKSCEGHELEPQLIRSFQSSR